jgi:hypothetical protein
MAGLVPAIHVLLIVAPKEERPGCRHKVYGRAGQKAGPGCRA